MEVAAHLEQQVCLGSLCAYPSEASTSNSRLQMPRLQPLPRPGRRRHRSRCALRRRGRSKRRPAQSDTLPQGEAVGSGLEKWSWMQVRRQQQRQWMNRRITTGGRELRRGQRSKVPGCAPLLCLSQSEAASLSLHMEASPWDKDAQSVLHLE